MKQGTLVYDHATDRYDIRFDLDCYYGGLHCGECSHDAILPQLCPSLRSEQALVKGEQRLVDLEDIVVPVLNEILNDDVKLVRV